MRPNPSAHALSEQLLLLTLTAEQAMVTEDWPEVDILMSRRSQILEQMESIQLTPEAEALLDQVQRLEATVLGRLQAQRSNIIGEIIQERRQTTAAKAYRKAS